MSRTGDAVDKGWALLDAGDVDGADAAIRKARRHEPDSADVLALDGAIAAARGDCDRALELLSRASDIDPEFALPLLQAAEIQLYSNDAPEAALALVTRALDRVQDDEELADCILLKAEAELAAEDDVAARRTVAELAVGSLEDPSLLVRAGQVYASLEDDDLAEAAFREAIERDDSLADAHHGLGLVLEARGDRPAMIEAWLEARRRDVDEPHPAWHVSADEFERIAESALAELPRAVLDRLENVPVLIDDAPSEDLVREGWDPRILGLFSGVPLPEKSHTDQQPTVDAIHLYQRNLERQARSAEELADEIRITVLHETAHFFGLEDDDLDELGLG